METISNVWVFVQCTVQWYLRLSSVSRHRPPAVKIKVTADENRKTILKCNPKIKENRYLRLKNVCGKGNEYNIAHAMRFGCREYFSVLVALSIHEHGFMRTTIKERAMKMKLETLACTCTGMPASNISEWCEPQAHSWKAKNAASAVIRLPLQSITKFAMQKISNILCYVRSGELHVIHFSYSF